MHTLQLMTDIDELVLMLKMAGYSIERREIAGKYPWEMTHNGRYVNLGSSVLDAWACALEDYLGGDE